MDETDIETVNLSENNLQINGVKTTSNDDACSSNELDAQIDEFNSIEAEYKNYLRKKSKLAKLQKVRAELTSKLKKVEDELSKLLSE